MSLRLTLLAILFLATAGIIAKASQTERIPPRALFSTFPLQVGEWRGRSAGEFDADVLRVLKVDDYLNRVYQSPDRNVAGLYIGYYRSQREGDTIHSPLNCLPGSGWEPMQRSRQPLFPESPNPVVVNQLVIQKGLEKQAVLYWYQSHGRVVASEYFGRAYLALDALRLNRTDGALVRVIVPVGEGDEAMRDVAIKTAHRFGRVLFPELPKFLPD